MKLWSSREWPDGSPDQGWNDGERTFNLALRSINNCCKIHGSEDTADPRWFRRNSEDR